jgi:membrane fusion protein, heavy metal efflux system
MKGQECRFAARDRLKPAPTRLIFLFVLLVLPAACDRVGKADVQQEKPAAEKKSGTEITLTRSEQAESGIQVEITKMTDQPEVLESPGRITLADTGSWRIGVLTSGRIEKVYVNLGDFVREGEVLARMHSHDVHDARAAYQTSRTNLSRAQAAAALAQKNYERAQRLYSLKAGSLGEVDRARQELANAEAAVRDEQIELEKERIHLEGNLGVPADPGAEVGETEADLIPIRAAGSGYILTKNVTAGTVVDVTKDLFVIGDLRRLWMIASVNEVNLRKVRVGQVATVKTNAFPSESFKGRVTNLSPELDPVTRVMRVRIELANPEIRLRPEMLASAQIAVDPSRSVLLAPSDAIQQINDSDVMFVRKSEDRFEVRPVRLGETFNGRVELLEGVKAGEAIVTHGSFLLKSQLLKSSIESQ